MPVSLYQKHRPNKFSDIVGQRHVIKILQAEISQNKLAHAYIFIGPRGTGKTTIARIFANAVNCKNPDSNGNPCGKCEVCQAVNQNKFLDLIEIDAASNRGVDNIRELKERVNLFPVMGKYKVYIIDEVHMLTKEAFNALLKTLEEPPDHVIFILATTEPHKIPATIMSRCERFVFHLADSKRLEQLLEDVLKKEGVKIEDEAKELIIMQANGSYRDMLSALDPIISASGGKITTDLVTSLLGLFDKNLIFEFLESVFSLDLVKVNNALQLVEKKAGNISNFMQVLINQIRQDIINFHKNKKIPKYYKDASYSDLIKFLSLLVSQYTQLRYLFTEILGLQLAVYEFLTYKLSGASKPINEKYADSLSNVAVSVNDVQFNTQANMQAGLQNNNIKNKDAINVDVLKSKNQQEGSSINNGTTNKQDLKELDFSFAFEDDEKLGVSTLHEDDKLKNLQVAGMQSNKIQNKNTNNSGTLSFEHILQNWQVFLEHVKKEHGPLYAILKISKPISLVPSNNNYMLHVEVAYMYHKQKLEDSSTKSLLRKIFDKIFNKTITLVAIFNENRKKLISSKINSSNNNSANIKKLDTVSSKKSAQNPDNIIADVFGSDIEL